MAYEPVVYHGQQAFLRSYIRIERAKRAMLLERQFKKMVAIRIYAFSIRICVLSCILYLIGYWLACLVCKQLKAFSMSLSRGNDISLMQGNR